MDDQHEKDLCNLLLKNYKDASIISNKFSSLKIELGEKLRNAVMTKLAVVIGSTFDISKGSKIAHTFSQIWICSKTNKNSKTFFGIESFNETGHLDGNLFIGIFNDGGGLKKENYANLNFNTLSSWWINIEEFGEYNNEKVNLGNSNLLTNLYGDEKYLDGLSDFIVSKATSFITNNTKFVHDNS